MNQSNAREYTEPTALVDLAFDNSFVRELPADPDLANRPRQVRHASYTRVEPTPVRAPRLLAWSDAVGDLLGIARPASFFGAEADVLAGNRVLPGMRPYAARYGGHQFGHWAGQLGDGGTTDCNAMRPTPAAMATACPRVAAPSFRSSRKKSVRKSLATPAG